MTDAWQTLNENGEVHARFYHFSQKTFASFDLMPIEILIATDRSETCLGEKSDQKGIRSRIVLQLVQR
jgi:hypothetical protein